MYNIVIAIGLTIYGSIFFTIQEYVHFSKLKYTYIYIYEVRFLSMAFHFARLILISLLTLKVLLSSGSCGEPQGRGGAIGRRRLPRWPVVHAGV